MIDCSNGSPPYIALSGHRTAPRSPSSIMSRIISLIGRVRILNRARIWLAPSCPAGLYIGLVHPEAHAETPPGCRLHSLRWHTANHKAVADLAALTTTFRRERK